MDTVQDHDDYGKDKAANIVTILTAFFALVGTCFTAFLGYKMAELASVTADVSQKTEVVSQKITDVAAETSVVKNTTLKTKDYVNHLMGIQLALNAKTSRRLADVTKADADVILADKAEADLKSHMEEKERIDAKERDTQIIVPGKVVPPGISALPGAVP